MRFVSAIKSYGNIDDYVQFQFPGSGILKNVSFLIYAPTTEVPDQDQWRIVLGTANRTNLADQTPLADGNFAQLQSARHSDLIIIQGIDFQEARVAHSSGGTNTFNFFYRPNKSLRIRSDTIYSLGVYGKVANTNFWIIVQGEYYPYKNSYMKFTYSFDALDDSTNFTGEVTIPTGIKNAVLEYEAYVSDTEDTEIAARVVPRIIRSDDYMPSSFSLGGGGGAVLDAAFNPGGDIRYGNAIDGFIIGTSKSGLASAQGVVPIRDILRPGDKIAFDVVNLHGDITNAENFKLTVVVHGRATGEPTRVKSHFLDSNWFIQPMKETV